MSVNGDYAGWAEPETDRVAIAEQEAGRHRADTVSNGISVEELLVRAGRGHD